MPPSPDDRERDSDSEESDEFSESKGLRIINVLSLCSASALKVIHQICCLAPSIAVRSLLWVRVHQTTLLQSNEFFSRREGSQTLPLFP